MSFSIITATFNSEETIKSTLLSLNTQTHTNYEHIIIDGASTDNTINVINDFARRTPKVISEKDNGIFDALNKGLDVATGEYIGFLHSDDTYASNCVLQSVLDCIHEFKPDIVYGNLNYVSGSENNSILRYWRAGEFSRSKLKYGWMPPHPTFFVKRKLYKQLGGFNTKYKISADYDSVLRFMNAPQREVRYIDRVLVNMTVGGNSNRLSNIIPKMKEDFLILQENGFRPMLGLLGKNIQKISQIRLKKSV